MSRISNAVAAAIVSLGWEPGETYTTHAEWVRLRSALGMSAHCSEWRSLCANLVKHLEEDQVVERMHLYEIKVLSMRPLARREVKLPDTPELHITTAPTLPERTRVYVLMGDAIKLFLQKKILPEKVTTHGDYVSFLTDGAVSEIRDAGCVVYLELEKALELIREARLLFSDMED